MYKIVILLKVVVSEEREILEMEMKNGMRMLLEWKLKHIIKTQKLVKKKEKKN